MTRRPTVLILSFAALLSFAHAQEPLSPAEIVKMLSVPPSSLGKSAGSTQSNLTDRQKLTLDDVAGKSAGGKAIGVEERIEVVRIIEEAKLPTADFSIQFDFASATLRPEAYDILMRLGTALTSPALARTRFVVAGHTDSKGDNGYNQRLSESRATGVVDFLVSRFGIDRLRLIALGYGEERLKNSQEGDAAENRRVEVVNLTF